MSRKTQVRQALEKRDAKQLRKLLNGTVDDTDNALELLQLIRHTGCLIDPYGSSGKLIG